MQSNVLRKQKLLTDFISFLSVFSKTKLIIVILLTTFLQAGAKGFPPVEIRGRIVNKEGNPLQGVSVLIAGTKNGTTTNNDGRFIINVSDNKNAVLEFSNVGFQGKTVRVSNQTEINITLEETTAGLEDVVVVGYGTQKKKDLTGAVGIVSGNTLQSNAVTSTGQALQGKVAGLQIRQANGGPGADVEIRIRGWGTFGANTFPLVVVDGIITSGGLSDIDPSNIDDITILKDASSAAIYGSRGANGVVLVTTKRGKAGKEVINVQSYYSVDKVIRKIPTVDAATYGKMVNDFYTYAGKEAPYADPESLGKGTNWQDEIFRTGSKQNYSLSMTGGTEKTYMP
ncbi:MAG: TonB-dependent receptor plug domain-containing protein [Segetibacter sp.]